MWSASGWLMSQRWLLHWTVKSVQHCQDLNSNECNPAIDFARHVKNNALKIVPENQTFRTTFTTFGASTTMSQEVFGEIEEFTCQVYTDTKVAVVNDHRFQISKPTSNQETSLDAVLTINKRLDKMDKINTQKNICHNLIIMMPRCTT